MGGLEMLEIGEGVATGAGEGVVRGTGDISAPVELGVFMRTNTLRLYCHGVRH